MNGVTKKTFVNGAIERLENAIGYLETYRERGDVAPGIVSQKQMVHRPEVAERIIKLARELQDACWVLIEDDTNNMDV